MMNQTTTTLIFLNLTLLAFLKTPFIPKYVYNVIITIIFLVLLLLIYPAIVIF